MQRAATAAQASAARAIVCFCMDTPQENGVSLFLVVQRPSVWRLPLLGRGACIIPKRGA